MRPIGTGYRKAPSASRPGPSVRVRLSSVRDGATRAREDLVATEEPCEIRATHRGVEHVLGVTMRTPGHDFELAVGWMFGEGLIAAREDIRTVSYCASGPPEQVYNIVTVELADGAGFVVPTPRTTLITSACGVCGTATIEEVLARARASAVAPAGPTLPDAVLMSLPSRLRGAQKLFDATGGVHAAGLFRYDGTAVVVREDVGRHNAVDKAIGSRLLAGALPAHDLVLQVSGRASFEIVAKAVTSGIGVVSCVSAPSSLAVGLAADAGITLVAFVHDGGYNLYSGADRIVRATASSSGVSTSDSD